jgi:hypothetical protein
MLDRCPGWAEANHVLATVVRAGWGGVLLLDPGFPLRLGGGENSRAVRVATRILGARHIIEAAVLSRDDDAQVRHRIAAIDAVHALSMLGLGAISPRLRRDALLSAASATGLVALSLLGASGGSAGAGRG